MLDVDHSNGRSEADELGAEGVIDANGKSRKVCRWYAKPWEILRQVPDEAIFERRCDDMGVERGGGGALPAPEAVRGNTQDRA